MKKGFVVFMVMAFTLCAALTYAATPIMWGIPDIIIGDDEAVDQAVTDNYFVFTDAFLFADYFTWITGGNKALQWHYTEATDDEAIAINATTPNVIADISSGKTGATFRNILITPLNIPPKVGTYVITDGSTDPVTVEIQVDNFLVTDEQDVIVYTIDSSSDAYTNEYSPVGYTTVTYASDPGWSFVGINVGPGGGNPFGLTPCASAWNGTSDAYTLATNGADNNFGAWQMPANVIDWIPGAAYVFTAWHFAKPEFSEGLEANWPVYVPRVRMRVNTANETVTQEWELQSMQAGRLAITSDSLNPSTDVMVFDPRDHSEYIGVGLDYLYYSFDLLDFSAPNRFYPGERDEEGLIGMTQLVVETFPLKMAAKAAGTRVKVYPNNTTGTFQHELYKFNVVESGGGGTPIQATTNAATEGLMLSDVGVLGGFGWYELNQDGLPLIDHTDDWHWYKFYIMGTSQNANWMRLRVFLNDYVRGTNYSIRKPALEVSGYQFPNSPLMTTLYHVFLCPNNTVYGSSYLLWAFDLLDFVPDYGDADLTLEMVEAFRLPPPVAAP